MNGSIRGKENEVGEYGGLTAEQKARISQKFRAAKALLARKRPRDAFDRQYPQKDDNGRGSGHPDHLGGIRRIPLSEVSMNKSSPMSEKGSNSKLIDHSSSVQCLDGSYGYAVKTRRETGQHLALFRTPEKQNKSSTEQCFGSSSSNRTGLAAVSIHEKAGSSVECNVGLHSCITPVRQPCFSNLSGPYLLSSMLDDDFDESILEEIDALCEHKSAESAKREKPCNNQEENQHAHKSIGKDNLGAKVNTDESTMVERILTLADQVSEAKCLIDSDTDKESLNPGGSGQNLELEGVLTSSRDQECKEEEPKSSEAMFIRSMPEEYAKYIRALNDKQQEAACTDISVPLIIVAGPGSGKTSTMVGRVLMLLHEGIGPSNILAMTFTTAAASEMRERIGAVTGKSAAKELNISTFHSFSLQLCRLHAEKLGRTADFLVYGQGQQRRAVIEAVRLLDNENKGTNSEFCKLNEMPDVKSPNQFKDKSKKWLKFVTQAKASGRTTEYYSKVGNKMGISTLFLFSLHEVSKDCQESWKAIVIDEFQDTSAMQYGLLLILASHKRITVIGDEDQSIFSFNGADVSGFDSFRKDFPVHKEVRLDKNYRSTRCIVEAASFLIQHNLRRCWSKHVLTDNSSGPKVSGKIFQVAFRDRKIPFNIHGVAFYRKKVVRAIIAMLRTTLPGCDSASYRRIFKALLPFDKDEKKKIIEHIEKVSAIRNCSFLSAAGDIFGAKISGTFKRRQLTQGRKVLITLDMISKLVHREQSISAVITSVANMIPQKYLLEQRAVVDVDGRKLLNEDNDLRSVLQYLLDDVSDFLRTQTNTVEGESDCIKEGKGCANVLKSFIDYISERETENFRARRLENKDSITLTTIHQANDSEIPLLHEFNGITNENANSLEVLQPSRFLKEIPRHLLEVQEEENLRGSKTTNQQQMEEKPQIGSPKKMLSSDDNPRLYDSSNDPVDEAPKDSIETCNSNNFLRRFSTEDRAVVSHLFHKWAKKPAFQDPKRLLSKVGFVIDERLRGKKISHKDVLCALKSDLGCEEAFHYAEYVLKWEQIPADKRAYLMREKQEHFQKLRVENAMSSSEPTPKQIAYLQSLGCTVAPTSRLHASRLIEEYKSL
nr:ATP-dependent DNA helicase SRS2-like protein At4g25120 [Ipomoea batatas]GME18267.1 ATP-dependent DNA helicase SRS2-like protein At4g25120 [Ipomoea batatas]